MKYLVETESDRIRIYKLKKRGWQMVSTRAARLYWVGDEISIRDRDSDRSIIIYPVDGQQPRTCTGKIVNPNTTRAYIDSSKNSGTRKEIWSKLTAVSIEKVLTVCVVGGGIIWYVLNLLGI